MKSSLELFTLLISIVTFIGGLVMWYGGAVRKTYAAQRDYEHLKNSYMQISASIATFSKESDQRFDQLVLELKEQKGLLTAILVKVQPNDNSFGFSRREQGGL